mmetsp:Transcript_44063/g.61938  ORF Transcript_44063/g.61938 Transcript_44063/m.61938 type:complete len:195 (-) Transcript_44063:193-777(-)
MDGRKLEMKGISICGSKTFNIEVQLNFGEEADEQSGLVCVKGEFEHTYDQENCGYLDSWRRDMAETEVVEGNFNPKTRKLVLLGIRRTGLYPKGEHRPPIIEEDCGECDCVAFRSTDTADFERQKCFCGHEIEAHKNRPRVKHLVSPAQYNLTLPDNDLSEKFDAEAHCQLDPNYTAKLQFWEEGVSLKPALNR